MDWLIILAVVAVVSLGALWVASRLRRRSPEELLEDAASQAERDRARTEAIRAEDTYNLRH